MTWIINALFSYLASIAFGVIINIPRRALHACGFVGMFGWLTYMFVKQIEGGVMMANLVSALAIGVCSIFVARWQKMPTILFNIPSLVPLVPGGQAYQAVRFFALNNNILAISYLVQVAMIAGAIAMGFFLSELVGQLYFKISNR
ncbi:threonine/serine exporter family protein [Ligilactobacillus sp. WILCCON 0076]|uniref:Threonine/serine exporter family protein n=1 Tax=Ligilactobacillus ubinensis TaxID=2876789 RepID=A0A9X2FK83_9LACO|nr:threonine/serine exporter family protein [Ligilactobacillus ubinensis]MCP0887212.1 threonine/serine exporter family protein [Ligilactobacillus ubinensis]